MSDHQILAMRESLKCTKSHPNIDKLKKIDTYFKYFTRVQSHATVA